MFTVILYLSAAGFLAVSWTKDRTKTIRALKKAWKAFENIMPQFLVIVLLIGIILSVLDTETISVLIGEKSGWTGMATAAAIGSVTLVPGFVAFPLAAALRENGAGIPQVAVFISTLMMVGVVTLPVETRLFGKKATYLRNGFALLFSFAVALAIGAVIR